MEALHGLSDTSRTSNYSLQYLGAKTSKDSGGVDIPATPKCDRMSPG